MKARHLGVRYEAARITFEVGDKAKAREALGELLQTQTEYGLRMTPWSGEAVNLLLKDDAEESRKAARRLFTNPELKHLASDKVRADLLRRFSAAKLPDGFQFYLTLLDAKGDKLGERTLARPVAELFADEVTDVFASADPDVVAIVKKFPKTADRIPALKKWLEERAAEPRPVAGKSD